MHITKWRKPIRIGYTLYDSNYMTSGKGNTVETVKTLVVVRGLWGGQRRE